MPSRSTKHFPHYLPPLQEMVKDHLQNPEGCLHLAIYYSPARDQDDVFLFEVFEKFGDGTVDEQGELYEVTFGPKAGLPIDADQRLHFVLTNPEECRVALRDDWELAAELRQAVRDGKYRVLYEDEIGKNLLELAHDPGAGLAGAG